MNNNGETNSIIGNNENGDGNNKNNNNYNLQGPARPRKIMVQCKKYGLKKYEKNLKFVIKSKIFDNDHRYNFSSNSMKILFWTTVFDIYYDYIPIEERDSDLVFHLGAILLRLNICCKLSLKLNKEIKVVDGMIVNELEEYIPWKFLHKKKNNTEDNGDNIIFRDKCEKEILKYYDLYYSHLEISSIYSKYIDTLLSYKDGKYELLFGHSWFRCVRISWKAKMIGHSSLAQNDLLIGISQMGIMFVHPIKQVVLEKYKMEEILSFGYQNNAFILVLGTLISQKKYQFATMQGKEMNDLLRQYIDLRIEKQQNTSPHGGVGNEKSNRV